MVGRLKCRSRCPRILLWSPRTPHSVVESSKFAESEILSSLIKNTRGPDERRHSSASPWSKHAKRTWCKHIARCGNLLEASAQPFLVWQTWKNRPTCINRTTIPVLPPHKYRNCCCVLFSVELLCRAASDATMITVAIVTNNSTAHNLSKDLLRFYCCVSLCMWRQGHSQT